MPSNSILEMYPDFPDYLKEVVETGSLARPARLEPDGFRAHAKELTKEVFEAYMSRDTVFEAWGRFVGTALKLGIEVNDYSKACNQVKAGFAKRCPGAVFSPDLLRESISMLEAGQPPEEVIDYAVEYETRAAALHDAKMSFVRSDAAELAASIGERDRPERTQEQQPGRDRPDSGHRRRT